MVPIDTQPEQIYKANNFYGERECLLKEDESFKFNDLKDFARQCVN